MNEQIKERWVAALRSGEYRQGRGQLKTQRGFCCLGVLCDLHSKETGAAWAEDRSYMDCVSGLPGVVSEWAGLSRRLGEEVYTHSGLALAELNDGGNGASGASFAQIADIIEAEL